MEIIDSQIHANHRGLEPSIAIMDAVGVDAAIIDVWPPERYKLPSGVNRYKYTFAEEAVVRSPNRFAYLVRFDPSDQKVDDQIAQIRRTPGCLCLLIASSLDWNVLRARAGGHERILAAAAKHDVPVMIQAGDAQPTLNRYITQFDRVQFILDHCNMPMDLLFNQSGVSARTRRADWRQRSTS